MQLTSFEIAMGLLGVCLSLVASATVCGTLMIAERNRFERYQRLRTLLEDICNPQAAHAIKLLAVHELRNYREYAGVITQALAKPVERRAIEMPKKTVQKVPAAETQAPKQPPAPQRVVQTRPPLAPFPVVQVANDRSKPSHLAVVETPKRDILDGVIIRERGRRVKVSVLREFLRFRDAVTDRLIYRNY